MERVVRGVMELEKRRAQTKLICEDIRGKISSEKNALKRLRQKIKVGYEYIKPESHDLKCKWNILKDLPQSGRKAFAFKVLEDIQKLLDKFNAVRHDLQYSLKRLQKFNSVYARNLKEFEVWDRLFIQSKVGSKHFRYIMQTGILYITAKTLPSFKWESQNWRSDAQVLFDRYYSLHLHSSFDEMMKKFDKLLAKLI